MAFNGRCEWCLTMLSGQQRFFCSKRCWGFASRGVNNRMWGGGRHQRQDGYFVLRVNGKHVLEHRVIAGQMLGRAVRDDEIVHHKNGDPSDNRPENLEVMSQSRHAKLHMPAINARRRVNNLAKGLRVARPCAPCNSIVERPRSTMLGRRIYCDDACRRAYFAKEYVA